MMGEDNVSGKGGRHTHRQAVAEFPVGGHTRQGKQPLKGRGKERDAIHRPEGKLKAHIV